MWFFMNTCYAMSLITFIMLLAAFFQNFFHFYIFQANAVTFIVLTSIIYLFTETLVIFFFRDRLNAVNGTEWNTSLASRAIILVNNRH